MSGNELGWQSKQRLEMIREACVESLEEAQLAQDLGADRIELCSDLELDGLTPSMDVVEAVHAGLNIPVRVMIRPRAGDFVYSREEMDMMLHSIDLCKREGVDGVVFGVLHPNNELDLEKLAELAGRAYPLKVTFHKAIDLSADPVRSIRSLLPIHGIDSVLTSGGAATALEGSLVLKEMISIAADKLEVIVAGKVTDQNIDELHAILGAKAYHGRKILGRL